jgi:four helix bundle protein
MQNSRNAVLDLSFDFALKIIQYSETLQEGKKFVLANQLLKSGTSIGANIQESQHAESKIDFIHKLKISEKEAVETQYWLALCRLSKNYPETGELENQLLSILKLLGKIISNSKKSLP